MKKLAFFLGGIFSLFSGSLLMAQENADSLLVNATLENCIQYALHNYPLSRQALLDQQITESQIKGKIADWYPQLNLAANYQNNIQRQAFVFNGAIAHSGTYNQSAVQLGLTQNLFNRDALLALKSAGDVRLQAAQQTGITNIDVVANVSKAFYDVLLTRQQLDVLNTDIVRIQRSLKDAYSQYKAGVADNIDYKRATISLNNSTAQLKSTEQILKAKYAYLKQQMGYPGNNAIDLAYDSASLEAHAHFDTTAMVDINNRQEFQLLQTQRRLLEANLKYEKWAYIPSVSAFANYNMNYLNNHLSNLYKDNLPNSYAGIQLSFPIFDGFKRRENVRQANLQLQRLDWSIANLKNSVNTEYVQAMAIYKGDLATYLALKDNLVLAQEVYNTINLQYRSGVKTYLEVITAETDLKTAQINYANALYQLLSDRVDVEKSIGAIQPNY